MVTKTSTALFSGLPFSMDKEPQRKGGVGCKAAPAPAGREKREVRSPALSTRPNHQTRTDNEARWSNCDYVLPSTEYRHSSEIFGEHGV